MKNIPITRKVKERKIGKFPKTYEVALNADGSGGPVAVGKNLKKVVKQLKGASQMHAKQAEVVQDHIEEMKAPSTPAKRKDACYHKVKARYDVFPSAYASGAIASCRKVGAANWGNKSKKKK